RSLRLNDDADGAGGEHELHDFVVGDVVEESAVVVHYRGNDPGCPIGWSCHDPTTRSIFLVDGECIQVDPFNTAKGITGITGTLRCTVFSELPIQFGSPSGHFQTTRQRGFGTFDPGLHAVLHDLPDVQDLGPNLFWLTP